MSAERINCTLLAAEFSVAWLIGASIMALTAWAILVVRCVRRAFWQQSDFAALARSGIPWSPRA